MQRENNLAAVFCLAFVLVAGISAPADAQEPVRFASVAIAYTHACALTTDGKIFCWGDNKHGQLGTGDTKKQFSPVPISVTLQLSSVVVSGSRGSSQVGSFSCALAMEGEAYCWGNNDLGQLGDGTTRDRRVPTAVTGSLRFRELRARGASVCGLTDEAKLYCWGAIGASGLGIGGGGQVLAFPRPTEISLPGTARPAVFFPDGFGDPCVLGDDGIGYCWIAEGESVLVGSVSPRDRGAFRSLALGDSFSRQCGLTAKGEFLCWRSSAGGRMELSLRTMSGRMQFGAFGRFESPAHAEIFKQLIKDRDTCGVTEAGRVMCVTYEAMGGDAIPAIQEEASELAVATLQFCRYDRCALTTDGALYRWSRDAPSPERLGNSLTFTSLTAVGSNACAIATDGSLYCWGENASGQVGDGTHQERTTPVAVKLE